MFAMKRWLFFLALPIIFTLAACQTPASPPTATDAATPIATQPPTHTAIPPTAAPSPTPAPPTPTATVDPFSLEGLKTEYTIQATLDFGWRYLTVTEQILYPNTTTETLSELTLIVQTNWRTNAFQLNRFEINGKTVNTYILDGIQLKTLLIDPLKPGETLQIDLAYEINIPPILTSEFYGPNPFGYTTRQINLTDWYPYVPPYFEGEGWAAYNPWFYGEHLVYGLANFDITLDLVNAPESTLIAASSLDTDAGPQYHYELPNARNFVLSISPEFQVRQEMVGETLVRGYSFPIDDYSGLGAFNTTVQAFKLFEKLYGPYPYESLTLVQADFDHGMEYTGLYYLSRAFYNQYNGNAGSYLVTIAAHEVAHQWWYGMVGNNQALEPWLDESLCTYSEKIFYEKLYPDDLRWWWDYRVNYYNPAGWIDSSIYETSGYRPYRDAIYLNGAIFLHKLRAAIGDEAFFGFLNDYAAQNAGQFATRSDFFAALAAHSEVDITELVAEYFQKPITE